MTEVIDACHFWAHVGGKHVTEKIEWITQRLLSAVNNIFQLFTVISLSFFISFSSYSKKSFGSGHSQGCHSHLLHAHSLLTNLWGTSSYTLLLTWRVSLIDGLIFVAIVRLISLLIFVLITMNLFLFDIYRSLIRWIAYQSQEPMSVFQKWLVVTEIVTGPKSFPSSRPLTKLHLLMCLQWTMAMPGRCLFVTCTFWLRSCRTLLLRYQNSHYPTLTMKQRSLYQAKWAPWIILIWSRLHALVPSLYRNVECFINVISLLVNCTSVIIVTLF